MNAFYESLSSLERDYWDQFMTVFQQVDPKHPERGIQALIQRARASELPLEEALTQELTAATERTTRRVALTQACNLKPH